MDAKHDNSWSPAKQALFKIRELKQQLADLQSAPGPAEPIAVVSMACRFPRRSRTPEEFWRCLIEKTDEVSEIPSDRWDLDTFFNDDPEVPGTMYARHGVFLDDLDLMDPEFFGISPREATWVDPQQRLLLEVGWEAIERASWPTRKLGERTGVFVGWMHNDYQNEASDNFRNLNPYIATGAAGSFLSGRLAYFLGVHGPSLAVDTACSSSLVALHLACQSLQRGDCDRALAGGVNVICAPTTNILTCKLKALSPNGHSRAFDAAADGYLRGEGCGIVTLRRLSDAQRENDPILGIIRGSAVGHNGFSSGLTAPNPKAQEIVIRQALERAQIDPNDVSYLEAHGTGTELGDPIEMQAAAAALTVQRSPDNPLLVGSVKTNIGHLEAAAGMAGLIKTLLALNHDGIPGQLNFENPNPHIPWNKIPVRVLTELTPWPDNEQRFAGVSAFGMSGTNAHVVLESNSGFHRQKTQANVPASLDDSANEPHLLVLSGKNVDALHTLAGDYAKFLANEPSLALSDVAYTAGGCRDHFEYRAAVIVRDQRMAIDSLSSLSRNGQASDVVQGSGRRTPKSAWQFTGQGAQYLGMARQLYDRDQIFRNAIDQCDRMIQDLRGESLTEVMFADESRLNDTRWTQPAIFAVQMGLVKRLESLGMTPDAVLGHSVGQYAAACAAGIMSWEDGLLLISERGRAIGDLPSGGGMLAIFASESDVENLLADYPSLSMAAINGTHVVISGPVEAISAVEESLRQRQVRCKALNTSHAFHSSLMDPVLEQFCTFADRFEFATSQVPLICNVSGKVLNVDAVLDGDYWAKHIRQPVRFSEGINAAQKLGCEVLLEVGPQAVLTRMAGADWKHASDRLISCLDRDADNEESFLNAIGQLYVHGITPDFDALYSERSARSRRVMLPTYPFQRRRFWGPDKPRAAYATHHTVHPLLGSPLALAGSSNESRYESYIEPDSPRWLPDHEVMGQVVLPGAAFVDLALAAANSGKIENITFETPLRPVGRTAIQTVVRSNDDKTRSIETFAANTDKTHWTRHFTAKSTDQQPASPETIDLSAIRTRCDVVVSPDDFYEKMQEIGLHYGPAFRTITSLQHSDTEVLSHLETDADVRGYSIPPTLLDGALHCLAVGLLREDDGNLFLPVGIDAVTNFHPVEENVWCHARWTDNNGSSRAADLTLFADDGTIVAQIDGLRVQQFSRAALRQMSGSDDVQIDYEIDWQMFDLPAPNTASKRWLIVCGDDNADVAEQLVDTLIEKEQKVVTLTLHEKSELVHDSDAGLRMCGISEENWTKLFDNLADGNTSCPFDGIAWCLSGETTATNDSSDASLLDVTRQHCTGLLHLIHQLNQRGWRHLECGLQLLTSDAVAISGSETPHADRSQYWGLGRVIGAEHPELKCRLIDRTPIEDHSKNSAAVVQVLLTPTRQNQIVIRGSQFHCPKLKRGTTRPQESGTFASNEDRCYLITGGLGKLGLQAAAWLARNGAGEIVLVSRRPPDDATREFIQSVEESGSRVIVHAADLSSRSDVGAMFQRFGKDLKPLSGVIHAAGVLDDALLAQQNWERFEKVLAPKVIGAKLLHEFTTSLPLDFFILYSSAASVLGPPGQSNYATANAFLDGLAAERRAMDLPALSVNWGPWAEGMADDERILKRMARQGITPLDAAEAHRAMEKLLATNRVQAVVMDVDWRRMRRAQGGELPSLLEDLAPAQARRQVGDSELVGQLKKLQGNARRDLLVNAVQAALQGVLSTATPPEIDRPLIEMGLDSLMAVEFGTELQQMLGDQISVSPTMLFDHHTIEAISGHVLELIGDDVSEPKPASTESTIKTPQTEIKERELVAIVGMSCRFPGARHVDEFWQNILNGVDSVCEIPEDRWDIDRFYSPDRKVGKMYTREGGFLEDIGDFDAAFFNINEQEACWIDPQHRLLLENSYHALEDAGISPFPLSDSNVGVFMGIMGQDYAFLPRLDDEDVIRAFQGAGLSHSAGVGRISYIFGFEGPSIAIDTASSSSLVAVYQAARSLQDGHCNLALAGGVNAILAPGNSLLMSKAGLLAPDGRCKSFSAEADGFGRGEGCGVVVLKRLSDAKRDGNRVLAVIRGGAIVHNGFSSGITAPSGKAQTRVINDALKDARIAPGQLQYLEAHGTGTEFGDPMELSAAATVYGKGRKPDHPLLVGSVKANISHLEAAGGISGLIKTVLAIHHGEIPPQIHAENLSPHIPWKRLPIELVKERTAWPEADERLAAVTALGLVGTNAHIILGSDPSSDVYETQPSSSETLQASRPSQLLVLSARDQEALKVLADRYRDFLSSHPEIELADVCHTASVGRRHFEHRLAVTAATAEEAASQLSSLSTSAKQALLHDQQPALGVVVETPKVAWLFTGDRDNTKKVARQFFDTEPTFRHLVDTFDAHLQQLRNLNGTTPSKMKEWLTADAGHKGGPDVVTDLHLFVLQTGLAHLWKSWGIEPDAVLGSGVGQFAAACVAGVMSDETALSLVAARESIVAKSAAADTTVKQSEQAQLDAFESLADTFNYYPPSLPLVCNLSGEVIPVHQALGGSYWRRQLAEQESPADAMKQLHNSSCGFLLEVGPQPSHQVDSKENGTPTIPVTLQSALPDEDLTTTLMNTLGRLYIHGITPHFRNLHQQCSTPIRLPLYPFQKKRYWITEVTRYSETQDIAT